MSDTLDTIEHTWLQQEGEPLMWFRRFEIFRKQEARRSILEIYNLEMEALSLRREKKARPGAKAVKPYKPAATLPAGWRKVIERWRWRERAADFDKYQIALDNIADEELRAAKRKARRQVLDAFTGLVAQGMAKPDPAKSPAQAARALRYDTNWSPTAIINAVNALLDQSRTEYNDTPAQRLQLTGADGAGLLDKAYINIKIEDV